MAFICLKIKKPAGKWQVFLKEEYV